VESLEAQLKDENLDHETRAQIGEELNRIGDTRAGVGLHPDGLPDIAWCRVDVPAEKRLFRNERGQVYGEFVLKPFSIAKYPVTYQQFRAFQEFPDGFNNKQWWNGLTKKYCQQEIPDQRSPFDNHPRDSGSWYQAVAFARWLNTKYAGEMPNTEIRLPLEWRRDVMTAVIPGENQYAGMPSGPDSRRWGLSTGAGVVSEQIRNTHPRCL
jgi:hypothetical protein